MASSPLSLLEAAVLGVIEGLTEYLPVSSTGHLILVTRWLGHNGDGADAFDIVIQLGAIAAVLVHYRELLSERLAGLVRRDPLSVRLFSAMAIAFVPTALAGLVFRKAIKAHLFGPLPVVFALVVGGVVMIVVEAVRGRASADGRPKTRLEGLEHVTPWRALVIGLGQCISMWPGSSRSMCTIVAGQLAGLETATAAEFSFLLGLPTLGAATLYEGYKSRDALAELGTFPVLLGAGVSFFVAWAVIALFLGYLKKHGLAPFGVYRIILGAIVFIALVR